MGIETTAGAVTAAGLTATPAVNTPPTIVSTPSVTFIQGAASSYNLDPHMDDADGDPLFARMNTATVPLPQGVMLQALPDNNRLIYDGVAAVALSPGHELRADDLKDISAPSTPFDIEIIENIPTLGKRWNPGHYIRPQGNPHQTPRATYVNNLINQLNNQGQDSANIIGIMFAYPWGWLEPNAGEFDPADIDLLLNEAVSLGMRIIVMLTPKSFGTLGQGPTVEGPSDLITAGRVWSNNTGYIMEHWSQDVMDREIAAFEYLAGRYDDEDGFEGILTVESTPSNPSDPNYNRQNMSAQWQRCYTAMEAAFPKANCFPNINTLSNELTNLFEHCFNLRTGIAGPDVREVPGWEFFAGRVANGEVPPRVYRKQLARAVTISVSALEIRTAAECIDFMQADQDVTHAFWITSDQGPGKTWADSVAAIDADPDVWTTCPTRYLSCGVSPPPDSPILGVTLNMATLINTAPGNSVSAPESDNWPITWASDGNQYTSFGDGRGFGNLAGNTLTRASIGWSRISGDKDNYSAQDMGKSGKDMPDSETGKSYGLLGANGKLYCAWDYRILESVDPGGGSREDRYEEVAICVSTDWGASWTEILRWNGTDWGNDLNGFYSINFLQFGQDYAGARDGYVYAYCMEHDNGNYQVQTPGGISLARVLLTNLESGNKNHWEWITAIDANNVPTWSTNLANRMLIFQDPVDGNDVSGVIYNAPLGRYVLTALQGVREVPGAKIGFYDAPEPWGPWNQILKEPADQFGPGLATGTAAIGWFISPKWLSADGLSFVLVGTLTGRDEWGTVEGTFTV